MSQPQKTIGDAYEAFCRKWIPDDLTKLDEFLMDARELVQVGVRETVNVMAQPVKRAVKFQR